ncbi:hypothetical protein Sjap_003097 [Stephania japonica]|uniref:Uncharacterized protein n=1 Tax=Stephania japonica TaxID=461633 RepID=A0AAP0PT89_9MAGN
MEPSSIEAVEKIVNYNFKDDKALLEMALTHSSYTQAPSFQRLEFFGDAALGLAVAKYLYEAYPEYDQGQLSHFREAIVSTEMLARVAVHHDLFTHLRHSCPSLESNVKEFARVVSEEGDDIRRGDGVGDAPKVLADVVESILAALYIDSDYDLNKLWDCFSDLLRPLSAKTLREFCRIEGKEVGITHEISKEEQETDVPNVFVDRRLVGSGFSKQEDIAETNAAKEALENLCQSLSMVNICAVGDDSNYVLTAEESDRAMQKLNELCIKKRWPQPTYRLEKEDGPAHERRFIYSVNIDTKEVPYAALGDVKLKKKDAKNSAASNMLCGLKTLPSQQRRFLE